MRALLFSAGVLISAGCIGWDQLEANARCQQLGECDGGKPDGGTGGGKPDGGTGGGKPDGGTDGGKPDGGTGGGSGGGGMGVGGGGSATGGGSGGGAAGGGGGGTSGVGGGGAGGGGAGGAGAGAGGAGGAGGGGLTVRWVGASMGFTTSGARPQVRIAACATATLCFAASGTNTGHGSLPLTGSPSFTTVPNLRFDALTAEPGTAYLVATDGGTMLIGKFSPGGNASFTSVGAQALTPVSATLFNSDSGTQLAVVGVDPLHIKWRTFNKATFALTGANSVSSGAPLVGEAITSPSDSGFLYGTVPMGGGNRARFEHAEVDGLGSLPYIPNNGAIAASFPRVVGGQGGPGLWLLWESNFGPELVLFETASRAEVDRYQVGSSSLRVSGIAVGGNFAYVVLDTTINGSVTIGKSGTQFTVTGPGTFVARFTSSGGIVGLDYAYRLAGANKLITEVVGLLDGNGMPLIGLGGVCRATGTSTGDCINGPGEGAVGIFAPPP